MDKMHKTAIIYTVCMRETGNGEEVFGMNPEWKRPQWEMKS